MNPIKTNLARLARIRAYVLATCLFLGVAADAEAGANPPNLTASTTSSYAVGSAATVINPSVTLTADPGAVFTAGKVSIGAGFNSSDELVYTQVHGIAGNYDANTGVLYLSGNGTAAEYQDAFRSVMFRNTDGSITTTADRTINFSIGAALYNEYNGHYYELIEDYNFPSWTQAKDLASGMSYYGLQGYLVTVTTADENAFLAQKINSDTWIGASDSHTEGVWRWVTGPEGLQNGGLGLQFSEQFLTGGPGGCSADQAPGINGEYANWAPGEPNDCDGYEDVAHFIGWNAEWNDYPDYDGMVAYYLVEYGGMPGDPVIQVADNMVLTVLGASSNAAPVALGEIVMPDAAEDVAGTTPRTVADILGTSVTDANGDAVGMAIFGTSGSGQWQRSSDGGNTWYGLDYASPGNAPLSASNAVLLAPSIQVRFVPNADWNDTAKVFFRAWDQTTGSNLAFVNLAANGGSTAFSNNEAIVTQVITAVNDAPIVVLPNTSGVLNFGGASEYVDLPDLDITGPNLTVEAWVYIDNAFKNWSRIIDFGNGSGTDNIIFGFEGTSGNLFAEIYNNGTSQKVSVGSVFPENQWVHVAASWNGSSVTIYQNGVAVASGSQETIGNVIRVNNYIGKSNWADEYLDGKMTDIRVWSTTRSQSDIVNNMNSILQGNESGLMLYYKASEPGNTYLADYGPLNKFGTFYNTNWVMVQTPVASISTPQDSAIAVSGIQFSDVDAGAGDVTVSFNVSHGTLTANTQGNVVGSGSAYLEVTGTIAQLSADFAAGGLVYTPAPGFSGTDGLTVEINDMGNTGSGGILMDQASIVLNVIPSPNTAPVMADVTLILQEDSTYMLLDELNAQAANTFSDADGDDPREVMFTTLPASGTIYMSGGAQAQLNRVYSFVDFSLAYLVPNADFHGVDTFAINASDGSVWAATPASVTLIVNAANDAPVLTDVTITTAEDQPALFVDFTLPTTFTDVDGDDATGVKVVSLPGHGTLTLMGQAIAAGDVVAQADIEHILYTPAADFNGNDSFTFNATDGTAFAAADAVASITITPVNDAPIDLATTAVSIDENSAVGKVVGSITTTDVDAGDSHYYQFISGAGDQGNIYFNIVGNQMEVANNINFERTSQLTVRVQTTDTGGESFEKVLTIDVNDLNDAPTLLTLSNNVIDEQQPVGTFVGVVSTADEDAGDSHTLTLVSGAGDADNASFALVNNILTTNAVLDYNTQQQYTVRVRSTDAAGTYIEEAFVINLNDINQAPTAIAISNTTIAENNMIGALIGYFNTTDPDANDTHTYTLVSGAGDADNASFSITNNDLTAAESFDFETKSSYSIRVRATDAAGASTEEVFTITVQDATDAPTAIALSNATIDENEPVGTLVGTFSTTDPDQAGGHTYGLVAGAGSADNGAFFISGNAIFSSMPFDYEVKNSYSIRVRSVDGANGYTEEEFTIAVNNINDAPTAVTTTIIGIDENVSVGTAVGFFGTIDQDILDNHTYTLVPGIGSTHNGLFTILANKLQVNGNLNHELLNSCSVRVRATDDAGAYVEHYITIAINDVNEEPTAITLSANTIAENEPAGATIGTFGTADEDNADSHTYSLVSGAGDTDNSAFYISGNRLIANASFNFEAQSAYSIRVATTDLGGLIHEAVFTISIINQVDAPMVANLSKVIFKNVPQTFTTREFVSSFSQEEGRSLKHIRIKALPTHGDLLYSGAPVAVGQIILLTELTSMSYSPAFGYVGADGFSFSAYDGVSYSADANYSLSIINFRQTGVAATTVDMNSIRQLNPVGYTQREAGSVGMDEVQVEVANFGNYPNPFQGATNITFELPASMTVTLEVYDLLGRKVDTLVQGEQLDGKHTIVWNGNEAGQYIARITATHADGQVITKTISLMQIK